MAEDGDRVTTISRPALKSPPMAIASRTRVLDIGLDTSGGAGFVRERLALLGKTVFLLSFGFYVFLLASLSSSAEHRSWSSCAGRWRSGTSAPARSWACSG